MQHQKPAQLAVRLALTLLLGAVAPAAAQIDTGPFTSGSSWFLSGAGDGAPDPGNGSTTVNLDRNGDGIPDATYNLPTAIRATSQQDVELRLSPTEGALYAKVFGVGGFSPCPFSNQVRIYMYQIGAAPTLTPFTGDQGVCVDSPLSLQPQFHDQVGRPIRTMALTSAVNLASGNQTLLWADLVGGEINSDNNSYAAPIDRIWYAPSGNAAFVVHEFDQPTNKRYSLIDLCASPIGTGAIGSLSLSGFIDAHVVTGGSTGFRMLLRDGGTDIPGSVQDLDITCFTGGPADESCCFEGSICADMPSADCAQMSGTAGGSGSSCASEICPQACCNGGNCTDALPTTCSAAGGAAQGVGPTCATVNCPAPTEACCFFDGSCADRDPATCSGTAQGPGTTCATVSCPALTVTITVSGPINVAAGMLTTYTVQWNNTSSVAGPFGILDFFMPQFATFQSASNQGVLTTDSQRVRWNLFTVPAGGSGQETVTVQAPCFGTSMAASAQLLTGGLGFFSQPIVANLDPDNQNPIDVSVTSIPSAPEPLSTGDLVTHTITLTNNNPEPHQVVRLDIFSGSDAIFDALIDVGSGTATSFTPNQLRWEGLLAPQESSQIQVRTAIDDCVVDLTTAIGSGGRLTVQNQCSRQLGTATAQSLALTRSFEIDLVGTNLEPPVSLESFADTGQIQFVRAGNDVDLEWTLSNPQPNAQTISAFLAIPAGFTPVGDPPFVNPIPPGTTYSNPGTIGNPPTILWNGTIAQGQTVTILFRVTADAVLNCQTLFSPRITRDSCDFPDELTSIAKVAEPPTGSYLIGGDAARVWMFQPDIDTVPSLLTCIPSEIRKGIHHADNGDLWLTGLPTVRVNLGTLTADSLTRNEVLTLGMPWPSDAVVDPTDGSVIFSGSVFDTGAESARIVRFDPQSRAATVIYDDPSLFPPPVGGPNRLVRRPSGRLAATVDRSQIFEFDPASPGTFAELSDPSSPTPISLAVDLDGDYIVSSGTFQPSLRPLVEIDGTTGSYSTIVPDLLASFSSDVLEGSAVGDSGEVYLSTQFGGDLYRVNRGNPATVDQLYTSYFESGLDLEWVSAGPCVDVDNDGFSSGPGCGGGPLDCDDSNGDIYPGAIEINDGTDNQCAGDQGAGIVDEVENLRFPDPLDPTPDLCWDPQPAATGYEVVRSDQLDFTSGCGRANTAASCWLDTDPDPTAGQLFVYLVRAVSPLSGSWGRDSASLERPVSCP